MAGLKEILSWFEKNKYPTQEQFKESWTSFWHKSEKMPMEQVVGLQDELSDKALKSELNAVETELKDKASKEELANVVAGLVPMGSVSNLTELEAKPKRNNDAYYVEDQLSPEGDAYIYRWDDGLKSWINTKQVVFKDVITQGLGDSSNKAMSQKSITEELRKVQGGALRSITDVKILDYPIRPSGEVDRVTNYGGYTADLSNIEKFSITHVLFYAASYTVESTVTPAIIVDSSGVVITKIDVNPINALKSKWYYLEIPNNAKTILVTRHLSSTNPCIYLLNKNEYDVSLSAMKLSASINDKLHNKVCFNIKNGIQELPIWEPTLTTNAFKTENSRDKVTCDLSYSEFLRTYYDSHMIKHSDLYTVTKKSLGFDQSESFEKLSKNNNGQWELIKDNNNASSEIFEYDFKPHGYTTTVLLCAGMNALELAPIFGIAHFLKNMICQGQQENGEKGMKFLYENVRFKVIPILCPSAFSEPFLMYTNIRGVNINRNFSYKNSWVDIESVIGTWNYKGQYPDSEKESRILRQWINNNSTKVKLFIDCHSNVGSKASNIYTIASNRMLQNLLSEVQSSLAEYYVNKGFSKPSLISSLAGISNYPKHLYFDNVLGVPSLMIEQNPGDSYFGGDGSHNSSKDIDNYVTMLRAILIKYLQRSEIKELHSKINIPTCEALSFQSGGLVSKTGEITQNYNRAVSCFINYNNESIFIYKSDEYEVVDIYEYASDGTFLRPIKTMPFSSGVNASKFRFSIKRKDGKYLNAEYVNYLNICVLRGNEGIGGYMFMSGGLVSNSGMLNTSKNRFSTPFIDVCGDELIININNNDYEVADVMSFNNDKTYHSTLNSYTREDGVMVYPIIEGSFYIKYSVRQKNGSYIPLYDTFNIVSHYQEVTLL